LTLIEKRNQVRKSWHLEHLTEVRTTAPLIRRSDHLSWCVIEGGAAGGTGEHFTTFEKKKKSVLREVAKINYYYDINIKD